MNNNQGRKRARRARRQSTNIKRILLMVCMMALVAVISIGGTIAWLTDTTDQVVNTFTESDIDIDITETDADKDGSELKNSYKMVPGVEIAKDPKVSYLTGNEAGWLFVKVEKVNDPDLYLDYTIDSEWTALGDTYPGVYYIEQADTLNADTAVVYSVLTGDKVTVKSGVTKDQMDALATSGKYPNLKFTAYAIQQAGFATAEAGWKELNGITD